VDHVHVVGCLVRRVTEIPEPLIVVAVGRLHPNRPSYRIGRAG
jgi:hypothetical protein